MTSYGLCPALCLNLVIDIYHINNLDQIWSVFDSIWPVYSWSYKSTLYDLRLETNIKYHIRSISRPGRLPKSF